MPSLVLVFVTLVPRKVVLALSQVKEVLRGKAEAGKTSGVRSSLKIQSLEALTDIPSGRQNS